mgnify:CR=1 FL=1
MDERSCAAICLHERLVHPRPERLGPRRSQRRARLAKHARQELEDLESLVVLDADRDGERLVLSLGVGAEAGEVGELRGGSANHARRGQERVGRGEVGGEDGGEDRAVGSSAGDAVKGVSIAAKEVEEGEGPAQREGERGGKERRRRGTLEGSAPEQVRTAAAT